MPPFNKNFEDYKKMAFLFLNHKGKHLFEEDILSRYREGMTLDILFQQQPDRFVQGSNRENDGVRQKTWYDIFCMEEIERKDDFFDYFFACKLRHLSLLDIDGFLNFHLDYSFNNNLTEFARFLQLTMRQHEHLQFNPQLVETINEWIKTNESGKQTDAINDTDKEDRIKGRMQREAGDKLTCLSQTQTALLIEFMQAAGIILKEDNLTYTQAGKAFHILTGYSTHTLRQQLGSKGDLMGVKFEDYRELHAVILKLAEQIGAHVRKK